MEDNYRRISRDGSKSVQNRGKLLLHQFMEDNYRRISRDGSKSVQNRGQLLLYQFMEDNYRRISRDGSKSVQNRGQLFQRESRHIINIIMKLDLASSLILRVMSPKCHRRLGKAHDWQAFYYIIAFFRTQSRNALLNVWWESKHNQLNLPPPMQERMNVVPEKTIVHHEHSHRPYDEVQHAVVWENTSHPQTLLLFP
ncbi:hypothetical protein J6590_034785 [Homalodisca vitripennis]|nr:hypothetical protein J6590_034785 [Homalodisca vitripennis]